MLVTKCDICKVDMDSRDTRYVRIFKIVKNHNDDVIEQPVHPELEVCVLCAENINTLINNYREEANATNCNRNKR